MSYQQSVGRREGSRLAWSAALGLGLVLGLNEGADARFWQYDGRVLARNLAGAGGSTTGPDGAIYVAEGVAGQITRIDPRSGRKRVVVSGLPTAPPGLPFGGPMDVAFIGDDLYVLITLASDGSANGIYRVNGNDTPDLIADVGAFSVANPPPPDIDWEIEAPIGVLFAMQPADQGFLVSDGHLNRVMHVTLDGEVSLVKQYGNTVPTGLAPDFATLYVAHLGAVPNAPEDGQVRAFGLLNPGNDRPVASGVPMIVDVEFGPYGDLYALSQGEYEDGTPAGAPGKAKTGKLLKVQPDGSFCSISSDIDRPTSISFSGPDGYVVTMSGQVLLYRQLALISDLICGWR